MALTDTLTLIAKAIGGVNIFDPKTVINAFGVFDTVFDATLLKVDAIIADLTTLPTTLSDLVLTPISEAFESLSESLQDLIVQPVIDAFEDYIITPILENVSTVVTDTIRSLISSVGDSW